MTCSYCEAYSEAGTGLTPLTAAHAPVNIIRVTDIISDNENGFLTGGFMMGCFLMGFPALSSSFIPPEITTIPHKLAMMDRGAWISSGVDRRCQCN